ncbi:hypothetical protein B0H14DRAFT_2557980 [Mycena olivaceomarginata]|nr:hypothetical protein B0H14DRAFT_2557980 [Mycena olivaceomarginata]
MTCVLISGNPDRWQSASKKTFSKLSDHRRFVVSTRSATTFGKNMSGTGVTYYNEELKHLFRLLKPYPTIFPPAMPTTSSVTSRIQKKQKILALSKNMSGTGVTYYNEELEHLFRLLKPYPTIFPPAMPTTSSVTSQIQKKQKILALSKVWSVTRWRYPLLLIQITLGRDLLADSPVQGADAIRSLAEWSGGSAGSGGRKQQPGAQAGTGRLKNGLLNTYVYKKPVFNSLRIIYTALRFYKPFMSSFLVTVTNEAWTACQNGLHRLTEFKFSCAGLDGLACGLDLSSLTPSLTTAKSGTLTRYGYGYGMLKATAVNFVQFPAVT